MAEAYPPEALFDPELATFPTLYRDLRAWMNNHGANLGVHPSWRVITLLGDRIYDDEDEKESAKEPAKALLQPRARRREMPALSRQDAAATARAGAAVPAGPLHPSGGGVAHSIGMRFRHCMSSSLSISRLGGTTASTPIYACASCTISSTEKPKDSTAATWAGVTPLSARPCSE